MWIEALEEFNDEIKFELIGIIPGKKIYNCNAVKNILVTALSKGVFL